MRKAELAAAMAATTGMSKADSSWLLNVILDEVVAALERGENLSLPGFGSFNLRQRAARSGKNPRTGEVMQLPASTAVSFKPGKALRDAVAEGVQS